MKPYGTCKHCSKWRMIEGRKLCCSCYKNAAIRAQYPAESRINRNRQNGSPEPTEAELDALIAERRATMPGKNRREE